MKFVLKINPEFEKYRSEIESILKGHEPCDSEDIYLGRNRLYRTRLGEEKVIVKVFKRPNIINAVAYTTVRTSKARRSFENGTKMLKLGFLSPTPVAYGEIRDGLRLRASYYICRELEGAHEMREWQEFPNASSLLPAFAGEMLRLHRAHIWHKDFSPGNILYTDDAEQGYKFYYVDLNRMKFDDHNRKHMMRMFRAINLNPVETARLGRLYAEAAGENPDEIEREALAQLEGYFAEQRRKKFFKRLFGKKKR